MKRPSSPEYALRPASARDEPFLLEMARAAATLGDRPLPPGDEPQVLALLPASADAAIVAVDPGGRPLGAAWWTLREDPLARDERGAALPELTVAVVEEKRRQGLGRALIDALAERAAERFAALTLNVHLLNPAVRLYVRAGFRVVGTGRGPYGVAMSRPLRP